MKVPLLNVPDASVGKTNDSWVLEATDIGEVPPMDILYPAGMLRVRRASELVLFAKGALPLLGIKGYHRKRHKEGESRFGAPTQTENR
ncbi:hypothetical protein DesfrDRAFT_3822 [Solidesulfovibrio fructosivorans JJ]]|uniref:Uncharacterized protein n=1 Tax=Solidesulfovibrio fructosivorans JJ] TaxID=596151 RepID=E1K1S2_SOLFR|nr:hypothetical protein [Solidesulfovibrio fructosivorans]EFL49422.1 hypothetical protein DesfrDRAFT_3822 [Solidesulfovibrio fructosivorans JJ]]